MLQKNRNLKKNQGFSLVELLVALAILAIIVVPLLNLFVVGAKTNRKAREISRATVSAQNLMEELKSDSVSDVLRALNGYTVDENGKPVYVTLPGTNPYEAVNTGTAGSPVYTKTGTSDSAIVPVTDTTGTSVLKTSFIANSTGTYQVVVPSIVNGGSTFDAVMTFEKDSNKSLVNANIDSMNQADCGYYAQGADEAAAAANQYADANATYRGANPGSGIAVMTNTDFLSVMSKTITVEITRDAGNGSTKAEITTAYDCGDGRTSAADQYITDTEVIFDNYGTTNELKSVYVYYYPLYNTGSTPRDYLVVKNTAGVKVNVYFICMTDTATYSVYNEQNYKAKLELFDGTSVTAGKFNTTVLSNLDNAKFRIEDHDTGLTLTVGNLGNASVDEILYNVSIKLYKHNAASFGTDAAGSTTFSPDEDDYVTNFTSSVLDDSVKAE